MQKNICILYDQEIPLLDIYPNKMHARTCAPKDMSKNADTTLTVIA